MPYQNLYEPICFSGFLKVNGSEAPLTFRAHINPLGKIEFDFDKIAITDEINFFHGRLWPLDNFSLSGKAEDGTILCVEKLDLNTIIDIQNKIISLNLNRCFEAKITRKLDKPKHAIVRFIEEFRNEPTDRLNQECELGTIEMGKCSSSDPNKISGFICIDTDEEKIDATGWHDKANKLLDHVLGVMHFAIGKRLNIPIVENYTGDFLEIIVLSQTGENQVSEVPVCSFINRQSIFNAAVTSFFYPPLSVKNLLSSIEWFVMNSNIYEVRLIHAYTALENLIASNLENSEKGKLIIPIEKCGALHKAMKKCLRAWLIDNTDIQNNERGKIYAKLEDLNRRSLKEKLAFLAKNWSVSLEGINDKKITDAVNARNLIVHEGSHNEKDNKVKMEHLWVIREIVIRFIFTAIGYHGSYISHLGGYHSSQFPHST